MFKLEEQSFDLHDLLAAQKNNRPTWKHTTHVDSHGQDKRHGKRQVFIRQKDIALCVRHDDDGC
eukprot:scaffold4133_cov146-Amphora_coffeaeformis.AAC.4